MENYFIGILILFFCGFFTLLFKNQALKIKLVSIFSILASIFVIKTSIDVFLNGEKTNVIDFGGIVGNVSFVVDNLSAFFMLFISIMSTLAILYSNGYLASYIKKGKDVSAHCVFLPLLVAAMLGVVVIQNAFFFLIVWEIMSLASFFLVLFEHEKKEVLSAGIKYLVFMHVSVIFIIIAFALLAILSGSLDFIEFKQAIFLNQDMADIIFILAFIGFGIKAGFILFHNWLPDAHPAAPSHVSAIMSGVMIKTGIYGILRILDIIEVPSINVGYFVLIISIITALYGVLYAIGQSDIKRLLAYSTIENVGIIGIGISIGMLGLAYGCYPVAILGFAGGILHILNHSIFKELLFMAAGSIYIKTHTRELEKLGGLIKKMPKTAILFLIASIAICALPPFNGFISEFFIYFAMLKGLTFNNLSMFIFFILALSSLALVGTMAILCFTKAFSVAFLGEARDECSKNVDKDVSKNMIMPMGVLACFIALIGLFPKHVLNFIMLPVSNFVDEIEISNITNVVQNISYIFFTMLICIVILFAFKIFLKNKYQKHTTWGCGYNKINPHMQYSASSYVSPFISMLKPLFKRVVDIKKPKTIFPKDAHFELHIEDVEEEYFLKSILKSTEKFFARFEKMQNGNIQQYITYGLIFLVLALVGVVLIG
ncbi:MAG: hypothetical protein IJ003_05620 [Candidatus Gastranaerophilales bacterium]|nr:hypothetical protein [Candidatus Gastranaerophilales bacterium]